jgi:BlaI family penicillinase repressor
MARTPQDVTEAELNVLELLWAKGPATIRQLADALYPGGGATQYATVQKLLERLQAKGCVERDQSGRIQRFGATIKREDLIDRRLQTLAEQLCGGSLAPLLSHLVRADRLSAADRQSLRDLIEELDSPLRQKTPKNGRK